MYNKHINPVPSTCLSEGTIRRAGEWLGTGSNTTTNNIWSNKSRQKRRKSNNLSLPSFCLPSLLILCPEFSPLSIWIGSRHHYTTYSSLSDGWRLFLCLSLSPLPFNAISSPFFLLSWTSSILTYLPSKGRGRKWLHYAYTCVGEEGSRGRKEHEHRKKRMMMGRLNTQAAKEILHLGWRKRRPGG